MSFEPRLFASSFFRVGAVLLPILVGGCFKQPSDISAYLERAKQYMAEGSTAKAKIELQNALKEMPADPVANLQLARIEDADGNIQAAVPLYLRAATPEARQIDAQLRVIEILLDSNRYADASSRINITLGSFPDNPQALALRADLKQLQGQETAAASDVADALKRDPKNARALSVAALLELEAKRSQNALTLVNTGLAAHPGDLRLLQVQAATLLTLDQPDKAINALQTIVRTAPSNVAARIALADIEARDGRFDEALSGLKDAVESDPSNQDMKVAIVQFLANHRKDDDLVQYLQEEIARNPTLPTFDLLLAEFDRNRGRLDAAQNVLSKAAARLGSTESINVVRVALAKISGARGDRREAMSQLKDVLADDPLNKDALLYRASLELDSGLASAAVSDAGKVTRADPVNAQAYEILATAYMQLGEARLAVDSMRRAVAVVPGDDRAQMRLAAFLQRAGDANSAREIAARQTLAHPEAGEILVTAARLAIERRDWDLAANLVTRLRGISGMTDVAVSLNGQLQSAKGNPEKAAAEFRSLIDRNPEIDATIIGGFASASLAANEVDQALTYLRGRVPNLRGAAQIAALTSIMNLEADAGRFDASKAAYAEIAKLAPGDFAALRSHVRILTSQKAFDAAESDILAAQKAGAPSSDTANLLGRVAEAKGDLVAARSHYKQALDANPLVIESLNNYASLSADQEPKNVALLGQLRDRFVGLESSTNPRIVDTIAWLDYRLGRLDEANALLARIDASKSQEPQIRFHAAAVLLATGDRQNGVALLDTVKDKSFPGSDEARLLSTM